MFHWVAEPDAPGLGLEQRFDGQADAEAWLSAFWEDLRDEGVRTVALWEDDRLVYGPMGLEDA